jgi:ATP-dependent exoDNAse (exonuclease V) alpha subunit
MAYFHFKIIPVKRSAGQQATGAAAYRSGQIIHDERTGTRHNFSRRQDVRHTEIFLPSRFGEAPMEWARDRARLWNTVEAAEKRRNSRVAREFQVSLPVELNPDQRLSLVRSFARELSDRYGIAVDLAIHDPKPGRESPNFHAHLLATTREVTSTGLGVKAGLDMGSVQRAAQGLTSHVEEYGALRERWATLTNEAFRKADINASVDHRSLAAQGIDRKPVLHIPMEFYQLERRGMPKEQAESLREGYRARVTAFRERSAGTAHDNEAGTEHPAPQPERFASRNAEEIRRKAVQQWLQMRSKEAESTRAQGTAKDVGTELGREDGRDR